MSALLSLILVTLSFASVVTDDSLRIAEVTGPKEVSVFTGGKETKVSQGLLVKPGDELRTAAGQVVSLVANDQSTYRVAPSSSFKVDARRKESSGSFYWVFELAKGAFHAVVKGQAPKNSFQLKVRSRYASLGVRGTSFLMKAGDAGASADVLEGTVLWGKSASFLPGDFQEVKAGQHVETGADGKTSVAPSARDPYSAYGFEAPPAAKPVGKAEEPKAAAASGASKCRFGMQMEGTPEECAACNLDHTPAAGMKGLCLERPGCPKGMGFKHQCEACNQTFQGAAGELGKCQ